MILLIPHTRAIKQKLINLYHEKVILLIIGPIKVIIKRIKIIRHFTQKPDTERFIKPYNKSINSIHSVTMLSQKVFGSLPRASENNNYTNQDPWRNVPPKEV